MARSMKMIILDVTRIFYERLHLRHIELILFSLVKVRQVHFDNARGWQQSFLTLSWTAPRLCQLLDSLMESCTLQLCWFNLRNLLQIIRIGSTWCSCWHLRDFTEQIAAKVWAILIPATAYAGKLGFRPQNLVDVCVTYLGRSHLLCFIHCFGWHLLEALFQMDFIFYCSTLSSEVLKEIHMALDPFFMVRVDIQRRILLT